MIEPSNAERAELPPTTSAYIDDLEARIDELEVALRELRGACSRYDDMPDNTVCQASYQTALAAADAALQDLT